MKINDLAIETAFLPHLHTAFSRGNVVLFTGAGFSLAARNLKSEPVPSAGVLAGQLWRLCYGDEPFDPTTQLQDVYDNAVQLNRQGVADLMRSNFTIDVRSLPQFYRHLLTMPWLRIYTLNVDNLAERVLEQEAIGRRPLSISATSGNVAALQDSALPIIHLNGSLDDVPDSVTFGRLQYAQRELGDPFYQTLRHDLLSRPVVFIGSSLEEGPMWQHIALRGPKPARGQRELRPRSYLVTRTLNKSKQALLSQFNVEFLETDTEGFHQAILTRLGDARSVGNAYLGDRASTAGRMRKAIFRVADVPVSNNTQSEYLLGAEPTWADAKEGRIAERHCFEELHTAITHLLSKATISQFFIVTGTAGTGKSSTMRLAALRLEAAGVPTGWIESSDRIEPGVIREELTKEPELGALFFADADLYEKRLSRIVRIAHDINPRLLIVCEARSSRVDRIVDAIELGSLSPLEFTIPYLGDADIDSLLDVITRENRLGFLKGKTYAQQREVFRAEAGRQMLVAMYKATHGADFREKIVGEWSGLSTTQQFIYGLVSVAHAHRFFLSKDEIAIAFGDDVDAWPRDLDALVRRKVILEGASDSYTARHREIAQFVYDDLVQKGLAVDVMRALIKIAGTKTSARSDRSTRSAKMLSAFISHKHLKRTLGTNSARELYGTFQNLLDWDYHYWLHRGALELESDNLSLAEIFLRNAKGIEANDVFVDNELAYLSLRKANAAPLGANSAELVREAMATFTSIAMRRPDQRPYAFHIMGTQGLLWAQNSQMTLEEKREFLTQLLANAESVISQDKDKMIAVLVAQLRREILLLAVRPATASPTPT